MAYFIVAFISFGFGVMIGSKIRSKLAQPVGKASEATTTGEKITELE